MNINLKKKEMLDFIATKNILLTTENQVIKNFQKSCEKAEVILNGTSIIVDDYENFNSEKLNFKFCNFTCPNTFVESLIDALVISDSSHNGSTIRLFENDTWLHDEFILNHQLFNTRFNVLKSDYQNLNIYFDIDDANERLEGVKYCELTGIIFTTSQEIHFAPVKPFENIGITGAYKIAIVCKDAYEFYLNLYKYIIANPDFPDIESYKISHLKFELTKETVLKNTNKEIVQITNYSHLFSRFELKTKREKLKDIVKKASDVIVNNLQPLDEKKINTYQNINISKKTPGRLIKQAYEEKLEESLFLKRQILYKLSIFRKRSQEKGLSFNMNLKNSEHLFSIKYCQLTGMRLNKADCAGYSLDNSFSIDRINRFEGYTVANVMVMCHAANKIKGKLERFNYLEDLDEIKKILAETKRITIHNYKGKKSCKFDENKVTPIENIINNYIEKKKDQCENRFLF